MRYPNLPLAVTAAFVLNEGGHFLAAFCFGYVLRFRFAWGWLWKIPTPCGIWNIPVKDKWKQRLIALSGFGAELLAAPIFYILIAAANDVQAPDFFLWYMGAVLPHCAAYHWYAGKSSD